MYYARNWGAKLTSFAPEVKKKVRLRVETDLYAAPTAGYFFLNLNSASSPLMVVLYSNSLLVSVVTVRSMEG